MCTMTPTSLRVSLLAWTVSLLFFHPSVEASSGNIAPYEPRSYNISVDPAFIEETQGKVEKFRGTADISAPSWFDGPPAVDINSVAKYWAESYDWWAAQASINSNFSHYITTVPPPSVNYNESVDLHFIHERSERENAIPMILLHGWPSTSLEWKEIIPGLVGPANASHPAFHVVAPDFPGFGFSPAFTGSRVNITRTEYATIFASLMAQLGYDRYILYSTDLGFAVAMSLVVDYKAHIINHISDFYIPFATDADRARMAANLTTSEETTYIRGQDAFLGKHSAYSAIHSTYPLTLAYALNDSPVGFFAWYYHLVETANDVRLSMDEYITDALLLYIPGVYNNIRSYKELFGPTSFAPEENFTVPTSVLQFGGSLHYPDIIGYTHAVSCTDLLAALFLLTLWNSQENGWNGLRM
jgi:pimeloyl-ACP methyl ester carboxylesterase